MKAGELFAGYGGLALAVHEVFDAETAWVAEWMMGLPPGWVTDIPISRTEQLRAIGNGVVPQQAVAALQDMRAAFETETGALHWWDCHPNPKRGRA